MEFQPQHQYVETPVLLSKPITLDCEIDDMELTTSKKELIKEKNPTSIIKELKDRYPQFNNDFLKTES